MTPRRFRDRHDAGRSLADALGAYAGQPDLLVLALPRGGVPVAWEVARRLGAPLDVLLVRKLGVPGHEELAMGAIASGGVRVVSEEIVDALAIPDRVIAAAAVSEEDELARQERAYREGRAPPVLHDRVVMLVDDGLATGSTMQAAVAAVRASSPRWVVVAVPVGSPQACAALRESADDVICLQTPARFGAVGEWYENFSQTTDEQVRRLLRAEPGR